MSIHTQQAGPVGQIEQAPSMLGQTLFALPSVLKMNTALPSSKGNPISHRNSNIVAKQNFFQPAPNASKITNIYNQDRYSQQIQTQHEHIYKASKVDHYEATEMDQNTMQGLFGNPNQQAFTNNLIDAEAADQNRYKSEIGDFFKMSTSPAFSEEGLLKNLATGGIFGMSSSPAFKYDVTITDFQVITSQDGKELSKVEMHEKLAEKFNKQIFKTVMTASLAQQKMGQIVQKVKLPELHQKHQLQPIPIPVRNDGMSANGSVDYDDNLIRRSDKNILYKAQTNIKM